MRVFQGFKHFLCWRSMLRNSLDRTSRHITATINKSIGCMLCIILHTIVAPYRDTCHTHLPSSQASTDVKGKSLVKGYHRYLQYLLIGNGSLMTTWCRMKPYDVPTGYLLWLWHRPGPALPSIASIWTKNWPWQNGKSKATSNTHRCKWNKLEQQSPTQLHHGVK